MTGEGCDPFRRSTPPGGERNGTTRRTRSVVPAMGGRTAERLGR